MLDASQKEIASRAVEGHRVELKASYIKSKKQAQTSCK